MVTMLELLDSAVKIGLGAAISGVATYCVTKRNQTHEIKMNILGYKKELLKDCAYKLDQSVSLMNESKDSVRRQLDGVQDETHWILTDEQSVNMVEAFNRAKESRTLAFIINEQELVGLLTDYVAVLEKEQKYFKSKTLKMSLVNECSGERKRIKNSIMIKIGDAFASMSI